MIKLRLPNNFLSLKNSFSEKLNFLIVLFLYILLFLIFIIFIFILIISDAIRLDAFKYHYLKKSILLQKANDRQKRTSVNGDR